MNGNDEKRYMQIKDLCEVITENQFNQLSREDKADLLSTKTLILYLGSGYAHTSYKVLSNPFKLSDDDIALACDGGNLYFGYHNNGNYFHIYTD